MDTISLSASGAWLKLLEKVLYEGSVAYPRTRSIIECLASTSIVDMTRPLVLVKERKLKYSFAAAEAWWILSGRSDVASISPYCKRIANFSDDGTVFFGAYGPKIDSQIEYVALKLLEDVDSRQALLTIWRESPPKSKDIPCTVSVQWVIREGYLHCIDHMRSNDIWLGFPYDVFNFSMLSWHLLTILKKLSPEVFGDLKLGNLHLIAGSHHLYASDLSEAKRVCTGPTELHDFESLAGQTLDIDIPRHLSYVKDDCMVSDAFFTQLSSLIKQTH